MRVHFHLTKQRYFCCFGTKTFKKKKYRAIVIISGSTRWQRRDKNGKRKSANWHSIEHSSMMLLCTIGYRMEIAESNKWSKSIAHDRQVHACAAHRHTRTHSREIRQRKQPYRTVDFFSPSKTSTRHIYTICVYISLVLVSYEKKYTEILIACTGQFC